ncbi:class B sortase [Enterocloster clostridioformis]|uniref:class B sortase n=1 Tax=Enterocloster clostridioformis TaxID=1531 RepID=UPI0003FE6A83|nr:class B sortase [Enterocloster clostridioformis]
MKKTVCTMLILIFIGIFALGAFQIYRQLREYDKGTSSYTDIEQFVSLPDPEDNQNEEQNETQSGEEPEINWPVVDFAVLTEINPDIVAWIYIEGTEINYPVVQGTNNQYYLKHLFNGKWNSS